MEYKDVLPEQIYILTETLLVNDKTDIAVYVIEKNAGWVLVRFDGGDKKRVRASQLSPLPADLAGQEFDKNVHVANTDGLTKIPKPAGRIVNDGGYDGGVPIDVNPNSAGGRISGTRELQEKIISTAKRIYKKPPGERMKINGFKYRIRHLDDNDKITNRCMFRRKGYTTLKFTPCVNVVGLIAANCPKFEFIEILSEFYKPPV